MENNTSYIRDKRSPVPKDINVSKVMSSNKSKNTKPELIFRKALWNEKRRGYRLHPSNVIGRPDICFSSKRIAIFINGCYWHRCPKCNLTLPKNNVDFWSKKFARNTERDQEKINALKSQGWTVITVWECDIKKNLDAAIHIVKQAIDSVVS